MSFYLTPSLDFQDGISHPAAKPLKNLRPRRAQLHVKTGHSFT
jgi:hypothetical protein